jgi:nucleoid-associated protein YgaU
VRPSARDLIPARWRCGALGRRRAAAPRIDTIAGAAYGTLAALPVPREIPVDDHLVDFDKNGAHDHTRRYRVLHQAAEHKETFMSDEMPDFSNVKSGSSSTAVKVYEVVAGDSLSKIAKREYGNANEWKRIFEANRDLLKDPDKIYPGQKLKIPPK